MLTHISATVSDSSKGLAANDACCILNFSASGHLLEILQTIPAQVAVPQVVLERELKTLQRLKNEENEGATQFEATIAQGVLIVVDFKSESEETSFVNYIIKTFSLT